MNATKKVCYICLSAFLSFLLYGNIYFWTDENGIRHFSNIMPPPEGIVEELEESRAVVRKLQNNKDKQFLFHVIKVFDGDTIKVTGLDLTFKVRLVGIDSPEIGFNGNPSQPFSQRAKQYLAGMVEDKKVILKNYGTGGYGRQLAEVFIEGKNANIEMIRAGLAEVYKGKTPKQLDLQAYTAAESKARSAEKGMWIQKKSYKSPKQWRKEHKS